MKPLQDTEAERRVEQVLRAQGWVTHRAVAHRVQLGCPQCKCPRCKITGGHGFVKSYDVWGSIDILAKHRTLGTWALQVTCQSTAADGTPNSHHDVNVTERRRKIEADDSWPLDDIASGRLRVSVIETRVRPAPRGSRARRQDYARIHDYTAERTWQVAADELLLPKPEQAKKAAKRAERQARLQLELGDPNDPDMPPM